jgi:hypothetical protein
MYDLGDSILLSFVNHGGASGHPATTQWLDANVAPVVALRSLDIAGIRAVSGLVV